MISISVCLHNLFENQVELLPKAIALKFQHEEISYQELNKLSNQLAYHLISKGVGAGDKVNILLERSIDLIVSILGILKSGATYVPINPKSPMERIKFQLDDLDNPILITNDKHSNRVPKKSGVIHLDSDWKLTSEYSTDNPKVEIDDSNISVILYTSGSTGNPKGVPLSHKALVNRLLWDRNAYNHSSDDVVLQHSSCTFDFSILEIFMALANGGKLILARHEFHYDSLYLIELIQQEKITKMGSVPSLLQNYIDLPAFEKCTSLEYVFLGGEPLPLKLQNTFFSKSSAELVNIYGPTEASISVLNWTCDRNSEAEIIPIGFPVAGMGIYLLNEKKEPVPDGEIGEIYITGVGLADGYYNRPELTASHFLQDPFVKEKEARMYKTGDWGKKLPNGAFQFLGRKDFQVKVRGLRIELQEIEHYLNQHPSIGSCLVACIETKNKDLKLTGYVIPASGNTLNLEEIKKYLSSKLPDYMVPNMFVQMNSFPLSEHGKIDRGALPYPDKMSMLSNTIYTAPVNELQKQLVSIWEKVLNISPIGITESFYNIGGDSLAAIEMHILMEAEMGCTLPLSVFANADTIQEQSEVILSETKNLNTEKLILLRNEGKRTPIIFVTPAMGIGITRSKTLMEHLDSAHPFLATQPFGYNPTSLPNKIEKIADHYINMLRNQYPQDEYILGGFCAGGLIAYDMSLKLQSNGVAVKSLFMIDTYHPGVRRKVKDDPIQKVVSFRLGKLLEADFKSQVEMIKRLVVRQFNRIKNLFLRIGKIKIVLRFRMFMGMNSKKKEIIAEDMNWSLVFRYKPNIYNGKVTLILAKSDESDSEYEKNIEKWNEDVEDLKIYEIPATHASILEEPDVITLANVINDHLLHE